MLERQSASPSALAKGGRDGADGQRRLKLGEQRGWSLNSARGLRVDAGAAGAGGGPLLGAALPASLGKIVGAGARRCLRPGRSSSGSSGPAADDIAARLQGAIVRPSAW